MAIRKQNSYERLPFLFRPRPKSFSLTDKLRLLFLRIIRDSPNFAQTKVSLATD